MCVTPSPLPSGLPPPNVSHRLTNIPPLLAGIEDPNPFFKWLMGKPFAQNVIWGPHFYAQVRGDTPVMLQARHAVQFTVTASRARLCQLCGIQPIAAGLFGCMCITIASASALRSYCAKTQPIFDRPLSSTAALLATAICCRPRPFVDRDVLAVMYTTMRRTVL
jgi:hypothetical protein